MVWLEEKEDWDLLNENRIPIGKTHPRGTALPPGTFHQVVHICIFWEGKLLIQQRQIWKKSWPGKWDVSVGGSVLAGETSRQAAEREIREELGVSLSLRGKLPRLTMIYADCFDDWWIIERKEPLATLCLQESEVKDAKWVDAEEVMAMLQSGEMIAHPAWKGILGAWKESNGEGKMESSIMPE